LAFLRWHSNNSTNPIRASPYLISGIERTTFIEPRRRLLPVFFFQPDVSITYFALNDKNLGWSAAGLIVGQLFYCRKDDFGQEYHWMTGLLDMPRSRQKFVCGPRSSLPAQNIANIEKVLRLGWM